MPIPYYPFHEYIFKFVEETGIEDEPSNAEMFILLAAYIIKVYDIQPRDVTYQLIERFKREQIHLVTREYLLTREDNEYCFCDCWVDNIPDGDIREEVVNFIANFRDYELPDLVGDLFLDAYVEDHECNRPEG